MKRLPTLLAGCLLALCAAHAHAQFGGFKLPDLGGKASKFTDAANNLIKAVREPDEAEETRIGRDFGATLLGAKPLVADEALQRYVNALGRWLALQTERPDLPWTFAVLDDPGFNAFATPGGYIFVTRGLVARMQSEAELAGVLAHEIAHVLKKHHLRAVQKNGGFALLGDLATAAKPDANPAVRDAVLDVAKKLYASGLDQSDEFEADRMGVVIAARAGYDPWGLPAVLQMLGAQNGQGSDFLLMFKTHPKPEARLDLLGKLMERQFDAWVGAAGGVPLQRAAAYR